MIYDHFDNFTEEIMEGPVVVVFVLVIFATLCGVIKYYDAREQHMQEALQNSNIVCEPVRIDGMYYCSKKILFIDGGEERLVDVDKKD